MAMNIKKHIYQQEHLIASAGVAPNKFLAKIASDWKKPNGLFVITPDEADGFVEKLSVKKIPGVGKVMADKLEKFGLFTCKDVQNYPLIRLQENFGKMGNRLYSFARGIDVREVETTRIRKSLSVEETFAKDVLEPKVYLSTMELLIKKLTSRLEKNKNVPIHKLFVKIKFSNFTITTIEKICDQIDINIFQQLLTIGLERNKTMPIRLLGVGVRFVEKSKIKAEQLELPDLIEL
jgi:DNA polymerase-4